MRRITKDSPITLVEMQPKGTDLYTGFRLSPRALPTLAGVLKAEGYKDVKMISTQFHGENGELSDENWQRLRISHMIGGSAISRTMPRTFELFDKARERVPDALFVLGGMGPSYLVEESLRHADVVVMGEGEGTLVEMMSRLDRGEWLEGVNGLAYRGRDNEPVVNPKREFLTLEEIRRLPRPVYDDEIIRKSSVSVIENERGCSYNCNFCLVTEAFGNRVRYFPVERNIGAMRDLRRIGMNQTIFFTGDNSGGHPNHPEDAIEFFEAIKEEGLYKDGRTVQVSAAAARNPRLLRAMRNAGVRHLCVGFESTNNDSLGDDANKPFDLQDNTFAAETFRDYGFWVHAMMMFGFEHDSPESARELLEWTKEHSDSAQFFILSPLPGTRYYNKMEREGRIFSKNWEFYDAQHEVTWHDKFYRGQRQEIVARMYKEYYSPRNIGRRLLKTHDKASGVTIGAYAFAVGVRRMAETLREIAPID